MVFLDKVCAGVLVLRADAPEKAARWAAMMTLVHFSFPKASVPENPSIAEKFKCFNFSGRFFRQGPDMAVGRKP